MPVTYNPCYGSPRVGKVDHEDPDKYNRSPTGATALASIPLGRVASYQARNDEMATCHPYGSSDENRLSAKSVDPEDGGDGEEELQNADHSGREQGISASAEA